MYCYNSEFTKTMLSLFFTNSKQHVKWDIKLTLEEKEVSPLLLQSDGGTQNACVCSLTNINNTSAVFFFLFWLLVHAPCLPLVIFLFINVVVAHWD